MSLKNFVAVTCLLLVGCGGSNSLPEGETGTVTGHVTFQGKPVPNGCNVLFTRESDGLIGMGAVDENGDFVLRMRDGAKIVAGIYRVSVTPTNVAATLNQDEIMKMQMAGKLPDPSKVKEIPEKYRSPEKSKTIFEVKGGSNTFELDMKP